MQKFPKGIEIFKKPQKQKKVHKKTAMGAKYQQSTLWLSQFCPAHY